jgi:ketosteroid isomerase-like protein
MLTEADAKKLAREVIEAWNSHDLERILEHYAEDVTLTSPLAAEKLGEPTVRGKAALRAYFALGLAAFPELHFELVDVMWGVSSVVLYYVNQRGTMTAEVLEVATSGHIARVLANYSNGPRPSSPRTASGP